MKIIFVSRIEEKTNSTLYQLFKKGLDLPKKNYSEKKKNPHESKKSNKSFQENKISEAI
jgi:hypothetical protein